MARGAITLDIQETGNTAALLTELPLAIRGKGLLSAVRKSLKPVVAKAKSLAPVGQARAGKKAGKPHLRDTITSVVRDYGETKVGVAGPSYPAGAHGHLIEFGHNVVRDGRVVGRAPPYPFLRPAAESTASEQKAAFEAELSKVIAEASK